MMFRKETLCWAVILGVIALVGCGQQSPSSERQADPIEEATRQIEPTPSPVAASPQETASWMFAHVLSVEVSGSENAYQFAVEISSPDTGCEQYADWWEVLNEDGKLLYRRILTHSHVSEQPFTRSGGPVLIDVDSIVIVRAHMHPYGYGGVALRGSVNGGFEGIQLGVDFAPELESDDPLPDGCAF